MAKADTNEQRLPHLADVIAPAAKTRIPVSRNFLSWFLDGGISEATMEQLN